MTPYRKVDTKIWADSRFTGLSDDGKLLWFLLHTGPQTTSLPGLFKGGPGRMAEDLGWPVGRVRKALREILKAELAVIDKVVWVTYLPGLLDWNLPRNPNCLNSMAMHFALIPDCELKRRFWLELQSLSEQRNGFLGTGFPELFPEPLPQPLSEPLSQPLGQPFAPQEQEQEQDNNRVSGKPDSPPLSEAAAPPFEAIIALLNEKTGKRFQVSTLSTRQCIQARWKEGYRFDDFKQVIEGQCTRWLKDKEMVAYLRPQTLFGSNFESYLNSSPREKQPDTPAPQAFKEEDLDFAVR